MKRKIGYKRQFQEMSYKTHEDAAVVVDMIIEKISGCQNIKQLHKVLRSLPDPGKNKEFADKVLIQSGERSEKPAIVIIPDAFIRNLKFKTFCLLNLAILIDSVKKLETINIDYFQRLVEDQFSSFNLSDEIQCSKSIYKFMDIVGKMQHDEVYGEFKEIPEEYQNLILLETKTLAVLLTKYTQRVAGTQEASEKIDKMIEEVEKIREQIPVKEFGEEIKDEKLESAPEEA